jgi:hypothetical protein
MSLTGDLGLHLEDICIARRNGRIAGVMGVWDQSAYKQNVVRSYSGWMRLAAAIDHRLPKTGEKIRNGYATFVCIAGDSAIVFEELLADVLQRSAARGLEYLLMGLDENDPLVSTARRHPHILYRSRLFLAEWPDGPQLHAQLDRRPCYVELATL